MGYTQSSADEKWTDDDSGGPVGIKYDSIKMINLDRNLDLMSCEERDQLGVLGYQNPTK